MPPASEFIKGNFTNAGQRLPYFYRLPSRIDVTKKLPLLCLLHGSPRDETTIVPPAKPIPGTTDLAEVPAFKVLASLKNQQSDPIILLWPSRRAGDEEWTTSYVKLISGFLDHLVGEFNLDTNRLYLETGSEGVHGAWDLAGLRPGLFAGARFMDGWQGNAAARSLTLPIWVFHSAVDEEVDVGSSRSLVRALRLAGADPIYTEYNLGAHVDSILTATETVTSLAWLLAQREGVPSSHDPLVTIRNSAGGGSHVTAAVRLHLAGDADALDQAVTNVVWENTTTGSRGNAIGSGAWDAPDVPLAVDKTNLLLVTATTVSWSPLLGGSSTFNANFRVGSFAIQMSMVVHESRLTLDWKGGSAPFGLEKSTDLLGGGWQSLATNAVPPVTLDASQVREFYRVSGH